MTALTSIQRPSTATPRSHNETHFARDAWSSLNRQVQKVRESRRSGAESNLQLPAKEPAESIISRVDTLISPEEKAATEKEKNLD